MTLFDMGPPAPSEPEPELSDGRRRTIRQAEALAHGSHPLALLGSHLRLHPDAPPADDRKAPGPRCGGCAFIVRNERGYLKCTWGRSGEIVTPSFRSGPYETHGGGSDLRAWWPGCDRFEAREETGAA
jgi:hypothetical protein